MRVRRCTYNTSNCAVALQENQRRNEKQTHTNTFDIGKALRGANVGATVRHQMMKIKLVTVICTYTNI